MGGEPVAHKRRVLLRGASSYHQNFDSEEQAEELEQYIHWIIDVDEATQIGRTGHRDGGSRGQAQAILASQASRSERLAMADDVLDNQSGTTETIRARILALHETYLAFASQQAPQV